MLATRTPHPTHATHLLLEAQAADEVGGAHDEQEVGQDGAQERHLHDAQEVIVRARGH